MLKPKAKIVIPLAALALAAVGGGAYAATQAGGESDNEQAVINDAAKRLNVSPAQLTAAFKAAVIDQIDAAVKAGKLTQAQANDLKQRIQQAPGLPFGPGFRHGGHGPRFLLSGAASYLGLSQDKLDQQLESGKSLAQVAGDQHKSVTGLEQAITANAKSRLDKAVAGGELTQAQEQQRLTRLSQVLPNIVNHTPPQGVPGEPGGPGAHGSEPRGFGPHGFHLFRGQGSAPGPGGGEPSDGQDGPPLPPAA